MPSPAEIQYANLMWSLAGQRSQLLPAPPSQSPAATPVQQAVIPANVLFARDGQITIQFVSSQNFQPLQWVVDPSVDGMFSFGSASAPLRTPTSLLAPSSPLHALSATWPIRNGDAVNGLYGWGTAQRGSDGRFRVQVPIFYNPLLPFSWLGGPPVQRPPQPALTPQSIQLLVRLLP